MNEQQHETKSKQNVRVTTKSAPDTRTNVERVRYALSRAPSHLVDSDSESVDVDELREYVLDAIGWLVLVEDEIALLARNEQTTAKGGAS